MLTAAAICIRFVSKAFDMNDLKVTIAKAFVMNVETSNVMNADASDAPAHVSKRKTSYILEDDVLKRGDDGKPYLLLSKNKSSSRRIMTTRCHDASGGADSRNIVRLHMCDIPEQLSALRDRAMRVAIAGHRMHKLPKQWTKVMLSKKWLWVLDPKMIIVIWITVIWIWKMTMNKYFNLFNNFLKIFNL